MNADKLDRLFTDYFHAELTKRPWPPAPVTAVPRSVPPDPNRNARRVLAASVALLLGSCWVLSNGFTPTDRGPAAPPGTNMLPGATADEKGVLPELRKGKAKDAPPPAVGPINLP